MSEWKKVRLGDVILFNPKESISRGKKAKKIPMDKLQPFTRCVSGYELETFNGGTKFRNGDTIMARITPCLENGKTAYISLLDKDEIAFGSTEYIVMRGKEGVSDNLFVYYFATNPTFRDIAIKSMVGSSGRQRVQQNVLENLEVLFPPLEEQRRLSAILSCLDDKIELNNRMNINLEAQAQAIFKELFIDGRKEGWKEGTLKDIAEITMGQSPSGESYNENKNGCVFYQGRAEFGSRFPKRRLYTTRPNRMAKENSILLSVRAPVGDINVALENCCIGRGLASIKAKDNYQSFLLYLMKNIQCQLETYNNEGTVFGCINKDALNNLEVVIPPMEKIENFEKFANPMDKQIKNNVIENVRLIQLRNDLLSKLIIAK